MYGTSRIERYLYSLPEYRMEIQRSHFIEIYSYNGLLATRKVIGKRHNTDYTEVFSVWLNWGLISGLVESIF